MLAEEDPFLLVQEESSRTLLDVQAQMAQWKELSASSSEMDQTEALQLKVRLTATLEELKLDMQDMQATVDIAAKDPSKFGIGPDELQRRRDFVSKTRAEATAISDTLASAKTGSQRAMKNARKERIERQGLLTGKGSSSSSVELAGGAAASVEAMAAHSKLQSDVYKEHEKGMQEQQQLQQREIDTQDAQLGVLGSALGRLGEMGKVIKEELVAQGKALDELTEDVDKTSGKMKQATQVMHKMLKSKDRGKFCAIAVLTLILGVLMYIVFAT